MQAATFMGRRGVADGQDVGPARIVVDGFSSIDSADVISDGEIEGAPWIFSDRGRETP